MNVKLMTVSRRVPGCVQTNFKPSRMSWLMEVDLAATRVAEAGIATASATSNGMNVNALKVNAPATPTAAMTAAASMGPQRRAMLNWTEFNASARSSSARGMSEGTMAMMAGPL